MIQKRYDRVIAGCGPGDATMAWKLAQDGKGILPIERGDYVKRERQNPDTRAIFAEGHHQAARALFQLRGQYGEESPAPPGCMNSPIRQQPHIWQRSNPLVTEASHPLHLRSGGMPHPSATPVFSGGLAASSPDLDCRAHGLGDLSMIEANFVLTIGAANLPPTIIANVPRLPDVIAGRWA